MFDEETKNAVKKYQSANSLEVDGIVGSATWGELRSDLLRLTKAEESDYIVSSGKLYAYKGDSANPALPVGVKTVGTKAFMFRTKITSVALPLSVSSIERSAFAGAWMKALGF